MGPMEKIPGLEVYKFGGASVKDAAAILNLCRIVRDFGPRGPLVVVVSAMGKTTNALEEIYELAYKRQSYEVQLERLEEFHETAATALEIYESKSARNHLDKLLLQLRQRLEKVKTTNDFDENYDQIISFGEVLASVLVRPMSTCTSS